MENQNTRTQMLIGKPALNKLSKSKVAVFGIGGVGSFTAEALARGGVGHLVLIDSDTINITNINRQLVALHSTIGKYKVDVMKERILDINKNANIDTHNSFFGSTNISDFDFDSYDYVVDAIDSVSSKLLLIKIAKEKGIKVISSMGAGNKLDPTLFEVTDIYKTSVCPLARVIRQELRKMGIEDLKVVYSKETPLKPQTEGENTRKVPPGSVSFVPSVAGLIIAGEVIKDIIA